MKIIIKLRLEKAVVQNGKRPADAFVLWSRLDPCVFAIVDGQEECITQVFLNFKQLNVTLQFVFCNFGYLKTFFSELIKQEEIVELEGNDAVVTWNTVS